MAEECESCTDYANIIYNYFLNLEVVAEAVADECKSCTDYQKFTLYMFLTGLQSLPEEYEHFKQMYDPGDIHLRRTLPVVSKYKDHV